MRHDQPSALRPEILAARIYTALLAANWAKPSGDYPDDLAIKACSCAASFIAEWRRRDPDTAQPNGLPADEPELEVAGNR